MSETTSSADDGESNDNNIDVEAAQKLNGAASTAKDNAADAYGKGKKTALAVVGSLAAVIAANAPLIAAGFVALAVAVSVAGVYVAARHYF